jgi:Ca-activated chloride channel homolog
MSVISKSKSRAWLRAVLGVLALGLCSAVVAYAMTRESAPQVAPPIQAELELAAGAVTVDAGHGATRMASGGTLSAGDKVSTAEGARALIRLPDGSTIFLRDKSRVALAADGVTLEQGEYWLDAPPSDRKALVHHVGGTEVTAAEAGLSIKLSAGQTIVYVARGMATLSAKGGRVEVHAGEQVSVSGAAAPKLEPVAFWDDWTGGMADYEAGGVLEGAGSGVIYGVDMGAPPGTRPRRLEISKEVVHAVVRDGVSETSVDQTFFNPGGRDVEGWYWFTVPARASVTGFAVETNGHLVHGEFIERRQAAAQYNVAKAVGHAPAILEWVDSHTYRARIYPVPAGGSRRVVLRYIELRPGASGTLKYTYPMGSGRPSRIGEFSLSVDLGAAGRDMKIATLADARIEHGGELVTMRRSGFTPRAPFELEAQLAKPRPPLTVARYQPGGDSADYVLARYTPDVDWSKVKQPRADVVVVVDTSAGGDEASRQLKSATAEAILRGLSAQDRFALVSLDVKPTVLHPAKGLAPASDGEIEKALEALADHSSGGATDLSSMFDVALGRLHGADQPAVVYVGDGIATSGALTGTALVERLRRALATSRARLFTVAVGTDADQVLLNELARAGGGEAFHVDSAAETTATALDLSAAIKEPTITDLNIDLGAGLDEVFQSSTGTVSRGQEVDVLARTHNDLPSHVKVTGRFDGKPFSKEYSVNKDTGVLSAFVPRLWAAEYVRRLLGEQGPDAERGRIVSLGIEYGLMTPYTSILALESEAAYSDMGIERKKWPLRGIELTSLDPSLEGAATPSSLLFGCSRAEPAGSKHDLLEAPPESRAQTAVAEQSQAGQSNGRYAAPANAVAPSVMTEPVAPGGAGAGLALAKPSPAAADVPAPPPAPQHYRVYHAPKTKNAEPIRDKGGAARGSLDAVAKREAGPVHGGVEGAVALLSTCSDLAARPLGERVAMWMLRLRTAKSAEDLIERYESARRACELNDWRAERTFLELMQARLHSEGGVTLVLDHFESRPEVQEFIAKLILRRSVDPRIVAAVERTLFGSAVNWNDVDLKLSAIKDLDQRIQKLREFIARAPEDPRGGMRLVRLLAEAGDKDEAVAVGRRLRDQGLLTPRIAEELGDVLSKAGFDDEAVRTYSEIVEFDPESIASRRLLGDVYLGHGWYEPAYRQYQTITEQAPNDALAWLRLSAAAAGAGRVDEALRIERRVASAEGNPGPTDPRRWARLWSAARLAGLMAEPLAPEPGVDAARRSEDIQRQLKELELFNGPGTLELLTWEQLDSNVALVEQLDNKDVGLGEITDAAPVGLSSTFLSNADAERAGFVARLRNTPRDHVVELRLTSVEWDGKRFAVHVAKKTLPEDATSVQL